jgi:hypothetical protein
VDRKKKRKYRSTEFAVNIASSVPPDAYREIEKLSKLLGTTKSEVVRRLILEGLSQYRRDGKLETDFTGD